MIEMAMCEAASDLLSQINNAWQDLANAVFNPSFIVYSLEEIVKNPLCIAITSALIVVAGFILFAHVISIFNTKH